MALEIYGTENDIGGSGLGRDLRESSWRRMVGQTGINHVLTGMTPNTSANLTFTLEANGTAIMAGHFVRNAQLTVACTASVRNYIWLCFTDTSEIITGLTLQSRTTNDMPTLTIENGFMKICEAVCSGSAITSVEDYRVGSANFAQGSYIGNDVTDRNIILGFQPKFVIIQGDNTTKTLHLSPIDGVSGASGIKIAFTGPVFTLPTTNALRPNFANGGFTVSGTGDGDTNDNGVTYRYIAFA